jgi:HEAT repeat protein
MVEPYMLAQPSWDHDPTRDTAWRPVDGPEQDDLAGEAVWRWLLGKSAVAPTATVASVTGRDAISLFEEGQLESSPRTEKQRILAIFDSARAVASAAGSAAAEALLGVLRSPATEEAVRAIMAEGWAHSTNEWRGPRRQSKACNPSGTNPADLDAMHALAAAGAAALPPLLRTLADIDAPWWVRSAAASAIGSLGAAASREGVVEVLSAVLGNDAEELWLRRNCAESLGYALPPHASARTAMVALDALTQALATAQPDEEHFE